MEGGLKVVAENIRNLQFEYTLADGSVTDSPANLAAIRVIRVDVTAKSDVIDPDYKAEGGYRTRQIISSILPRNMALSQ